MSQYNPGSSSTNMSLFPSASRRFGYKVGWCGDSITAGSSTTNTTVYSFRAYLPKLLGYRIATDSINGGVPGERSDQLLARMESIISQGAQLLSVMIGTNDANQGVSLATYQQNIIGIKAKADRAGIPIVFCLIPPRGAAASADSKQRTHIFNMWLRLWCIQNGIPLVDTFTPLVDNTLGTMKTAYDVDGTHPNNAGHYEIAKAISAVLDTYLPKLPWFVNTKGVGLASNPLFADGANGWTLAAATGSIYPAASYVENDGKLPSGRWLKYTLDNSAGSTATTSTVGMDMDTTKYAVGDELLVALYYRPSTENSKLQTLDNAAILTTPVLALVPNLAVPYLQKIVVPTTTNRFRFGFSLTANAGETVTFEVGAANVFNLTTFGISGINV